MGFKALVATRNIFGKKEEKLLFVITFISILSIAISICSLIVVLSVMDGFGYELRKRIVGVQPHIKIANIEGEIKNYNEILNKIDDIFIVSAYPYIEGQAIFRGKKIHGGVIYGMDKIEGIKLEKGSLPTSSSILLGKELSFILGVFTNEEISIITGDKKPKISFLSVSGLFSSGIYAYDASVAYIPLSVAKRIFKRDGVSGIGIFVSDIYKVDEVKERLYKILPSYLIIKTWEELNENLMSALKLERNVMLLLLTIFLLIALFGVSSLLIITIIKKKREIGILRLLGASRLSIASIFLIEGGIIGAIGTFLGILLSFLACWFISSSLSLPSDIYYISSIPVRFDWKNILIIGSLAPFLSILFSLWPSIWASSIPLSEALREE